MGKREGRWEMEDGGQLRCNKKADLELDEVIKIMLGVVLLIILLAVIWYIKGEFFGQEASIKESFNIFK